MKDTRIKKFFKKTITFAIGYPLYFLSHFIVRNKKKIVVGSHTPFSDNSKYFFILSQKFLQDYNIIWLTNDKEVVEHINRIGLKAFRVKTFKGLFHALTAKYYIYSFHLHDINFWTSGGSVKFNLWHGIPLKDIGFAIKSGPSVKIYNEKGVLVRFLRPHIFVRPNYMLTTSSEMSKYFAKAFRIKQEQCLEFGMPRCDFLTWTKDELLKYIKKYEPEATMNLVKKISEYKKVFIYMPTWREKVDFLYDAKFDFEKLNNVLKQENKVFLLKLHPFTKLKKIDIHSINKYSNIIILDSNFDAYPILPFTDCLISDYSSIYYDYLLCSGNKEIYLFPFDYNSYKIESRDLAFDYNKAMPGQRIKDFNHLLEILKKNKKETLSKEQIAIKEHYFKQVPGLSTEKLSRFIEKLNQQF